MKVGDLVKKNGDLDVGEKGLVLAITTNALGNTFLKILKFNGTIITWYEDLVEIIYESG